ncbi:hypothetical protein AB0M43_14625 [Longispora sp. NPDC051575]|uniref:hypothetical protein n=1 Tax=Longispora sp. NPDC051575 TaxID=3154943 RepID=UPI003432C1C9
MTITPCGTEPAAPTSSLIIDEGAFRRLERELLDLGFEPIVPTEDGIAIFRCDEIPASEGETTTFDVVFDRRSCMATATIIPGGAHESCGPRITFNARVPAVTQIVTLYGALNPDPGGAVESIACTYQVKPWSEGTATPS